MTAMPFAEPFGLAWLGFVLYALLIIVIAWFVLFILPWLITISGTLFTIIMFPINVILGLFSRGRKKKINLFRKR